MENQTKDLIEVTMHPDLIIIEPHPGDCIISALVMLGSLDCDVITLSSPNPQLSSKCLLNSGLKINDVIDLGFKDYPYSSGCDISTHGCITTYQDIYKLIEDVSGILADYRYVASPVGLQHPMHIITRFVCDKAATHLYLDYPCSSNGTEKMSMDMTSLADYSKSEYQAHRGLKGAMLRKYGLVYKNFPLREVIWSKYSDSGGLLWNSGSIQ